jgi:metal-responsive CopG/Arc/MetJ family transcriptional regulator
MAAKAKCRTQVMLSEQLVKRIDSIVSSRKRSEFLEKAAVEKLRREALREWRDLRKRFRGLTLEDTYWKAREELEAR